eukprot:gnl/MRDRNA2_/MRDRNA2_333010_c0_seq1.p1 gnl/MRDRNA2_/MRDRNA2_333010_c0~~gnl/MRDRNA2_/MRDRNA2_333010_c0_seq1.p1  ORF type:complete len:132 (+),score=14.38 gnl/MRDRNA2_/MRDRNA2_333010_c0_seq1:159-554(+)
MSFLDFVNSEHNVTNHHASILNCSLDSQMLLGNEGNTCVVFQVACNKYQQMQLLIPRSSVLLEQTLHQSAAVLWCIALLQKSKHQLRAYGCYSLPIHSAPMLNKPHTGPQEDPQSSTKAYIQCISMAPTNF